MISFSFLSKDLKMPHISAQMNFETDDQGHLNVTIDTERLRLESVQAKDLESYEAYLYQDPEVMASIGLGGTRNEEYVRQRIDEWRFKWNFQDPFSTFTVHYNQTNAFLGMISLSAPFPQEYCHSKVVEPENTASLVFMYKKDCWKQGIGTEATEAVVLDYVPELQDRQFKIKNDKPLMYLYATAREDNVAACKILEKTGFTHEDTQDLYGAIRTVNYKRA